MKNKINFFDWCIENNKDYYKYWDYDLNKINPNEVCSTTGKKYYFKCTNGHKSYLKVINNLRNSKKLTCPECNSFYQWCLANNRFDLINAWDYEKNPDIKQISKCSAKYVFFKINNQYLKSKPSNITSSTIKKSDPIKKYYNSIGYFIFSKYGNDSIDKYWSDKNTCSPFEVDAGSNKKVWIKCDKKDYHDDYNVIAYSFKNGCRCPMCSSKIIHKNDSFAQFNINRFGSDWIEKCWCDDNVVDPFKLAIFNNDIKIHLKCKSVDYHDFYTTPSNFSSKKSFCPYCGTNGTHKKTHKNDSIGSKHPKILSQWSTKNKHTPYDYPLFSHSKVWLKCEKGLHEDFLRSISSYSNGFTSCSKCVLSNKISSYQKSVFEFLTNDLKLNVKTEMSCECIPINPITNMPMPFDNEIKNMNTVIEVHGIQHYKLSGWHITQSKKSNKSPLEEFEYQKWKDKFKKDYAISKGYNYIEIPYWTVEDGSYKNIIKQNMNIN